MKTYRLDPIDSDVAARLRSDGGDRYIADSKPGFPCRQCLQDAEVGEALILVSHDPFDEAADSAYRSPSPIFLHETPCGADETFEDLPDQLTVRQLSVRAFDAGAMMVDAKVIDGVDLDDVLRRFFDADGTDYVHIHNASRGCWATTARRVAESG